MAFKKTIREKIYFKDKFTPEELNLIKSYPDPSQVKDKLLKKQLNRISNKAKNINKEIYSRRSNRKNLEIKAVDAYRVGLIDDKYKIPYLESQYPELRFKDDNNEIVVSGDGVTFRKIDLDPKFKIASAIGMITPFALGVTGGIAGLAGGPLGALGLGGLAASGAQVSKETIEQKIPDELRQYHGLADKQDLIQSASDIATTGVGDIASSVAFGKLVEGGGLLAKQPVVKKQISKIGDSLVKPLRRIGNVSDEFTKARQRIAEYKLVQDTLNAVKGRKPGQAGERLQNLLQDKVDADDLLVDNLWKQNRAQVSEATNNLSKSVKDIRTRIKLANPNLSEFQLRKLTGEAVAKEPGFLIDFSPQFGQFLESLTVAGARTGSGIKESVAKDVINALKASRSTGKTGSLLNEAGLKQFSLKSVTPDDLHNLRSFLGKRIAQATSAGENELKRTLTQFKNNLDERLSLDDIPGATFAKEALEKQRQSYIELPSSVRDSVLKRPSKGVIREIDPETAFNKVLKFDSVDRAKVGSIIQSSPEQADEFAKDIQAYAVNKPKTIYRDKLNIRPKALEDAQFTTKSGMREAIKEGYVPNTEAVKKSLKIDPGSQIEDISDSSHGFLSQNPEFEDLIGTDRYFKISQPLENIERLRTATNSAPKILGKGTGETAKGVVNRGLGLANPFLGFVGNAIEPAIRPVARAATATADELRSARSFSNPSLNTAAGIARGGGNELAGILGNLNDRLAGAGVGPNARQSDIEQQLLEGASFANDPNQIPNLTPEERIRLKGRASINLSDLLGAF